MSESEHWHFTLYMAAAYPPQVRSAFSEPYGSLTSAKVAIKNWIKDDLLPDSDRMVLVGLPEEKIMSVVGEWMRRPQEPFICVLPYLFECYPCDGCCDDAVFQNAREMADYLTAAEIVPAKVVGRPGDCRMVAAASDWGDRIVAVDSDRR